MLFSVATMFVYPSKYEGFGLSGLEAMVAGCPTVLSDIPPFREQLGVLGDVAWNFGPDDPVALADRLQEILATPSETMSRARHAGAMVRAHFSWQSTARGYLDVFERAIRTHRGVR